MKRKVILAIVVLYLLIGVVIAISWSVNYDPTSGISAPNNASMFIVNALLWPLWVGI